MTRFQRINLVLGVAALLVSGLVIGQTPFRPGAEATSASAHGTR